MQHRIYAALKVKKGETCFKKTGGLTTRAELYLV